MKIVLAVDGSKALVDAMDAFPAFRDASESNGGPMPSSWPRLRILPVPTEPTPQEPREPKNEYLEKTDRDGSYWIGLSW